MDWFVCDIGLRHEGVKLICCHTDLTDPDFLKIKKIVYCQDNSSKILFGAFLS